MIRYSVAPMMDWTDRHYRYMARLISKSVWLYTEMVTANAIVHGNREWLLARDIFEEPVVLQLGGSEPELLSDSVKIAAPYDYQEMNLNCGCPSPRVKKGAFGACLMAEPELVADCVIAMSEQTDKPITVKTRIGIDHQDSYEFLVRFVDIISSRTDCDRFILHARKAWLNGLSPKENREKPPLNYQRVVDLKAQFPHIAIELNGGLSLMDDLEQQYPSLDGFMIGREAYHAPYNLAHLESSPLTEHEVVKTYMNYVETQLAAGIRMQTLIKPLLGLFQGQPGARQWRRILSTQAKSQQVSVISEALNCINLQ